MYVYNVHMSVIWRKAWHCDECSHEWLQTDGVVPTHCPNRDCRSRKYDRNSPQQRPETNPDTIATPTTQPVAAIYARPKHDPTCKCLTCQP